MYRTFLFLAFLLVLEAFVVWRPFDTGAIAWQSSWDNKKTAGQIVDGFHLSQDVPAKLLARPVPKRHITHWWRSHRKLLAHAPNCFAIRFATYNRQNSGHISVSYRQGDASQKWLVDSNSLRNEYRRFCPSAGIQSDQPLHISLTGIDGKSGQAATVWLSHSKRLKPATINDYHSKKRSLNLRLGYFHRVSPMETLGIDKSTYALACLASLMIALVAVPALSKRD